MRRLSALRWAPLLVLFGAWSSCDQDLLGDPGFDLWCGDHLCSWTVEEGEVEPVSTWHEEDHGASLIGPLVSLSQRSEVTAAEVDCLRFELVADVADGAALTLEMDFWDDGWVEVEQPITADDWEQGHFTLRPPARFEAVRFRLRKEGEARAVIAVVRVLAVDDEDCPGEALPIDHEPLGAECEADEECGSERCEAIPVVHSGGPADEAETCGACEADGDCAGGLVCGLSWTEGRWTGQRDCVAAGGKVLGVACAEGAECASGLCEEAQCAACASEADCGGATCGRSEEAALAPLACDPDGGAVPSGGACLWDSDCEGGVCDHTEEVRICDPDGRPCAVDADCPWSALGGTCAAVGAADGICR